MTEILPSYVNGAVVDAGCRRPRQVRDRGARRVDRRGGHPRLDRGARPRRRARVRAHGRAGQPRRADVPPAGGAAQADGARAHRAQGRALRAVEPHRRDEAGLVGRHRRRHRRALHLLGQGSARDAELQGLRRRRRREPLEGRLIPRTAYLHPPARRGRADQRVQLPGVGLAREVRPRVPRGRADAREARDARPATSPRRSCASSSSRACCPTAPCSSSRAACPTSSTTFASATSSAFTGSASTAEKLRANDSVQTGGVRFTSETDSINASRARHRRGRGHARVRRVREAARRRDDHEGGAEVHRDPPGDRARGIRRRRHRCRARAHRRTRRRRRPARRGRDDGPARLDRAARRGAAAGRPPRGGRRRARHRVDGCPGRDPRRRIDRRRRRRRLRRADAAALHGCREPRRCTRSRRSGRSRRSSATTRSPTRPRSSRAAAVRS